MTQEKRSVLAVVLSVAVFFVWQFFFATKAPKPSEAPAPAATVASPATPSAPPVSTVPPVVKAEEVPAHEDTFTFDTMTVTLSSLGGAAKSWQLNRFSSSKNVPIEVVPEGSSVLGTQFEASVPLPAQLSFRVVEKTDKQIRYEWQSKELKISKTITFHPEQYSADVQVELTSLGQQPVQASPTMTWTAVHAKSEGGLLHSLRGPPNVWTPVYDLAGKVVRETNLKDMDVPTNAADRLKWAGVEDRYFVSAMIPRSGNASELFLKTIPPPNGSEAAAEVRIEMSPMVVPAGGTATSQTTVFVGPKETELLQAMGVGLDQVIDYGWFGFFARPILMALQFLYGILHNYGLAIIALTLIIKLLMHPVTKKQMQSMRAMQALQPQMKQLREKIKDRERLNMEMMQLFKTHKVNPMGGCLPMVLQMPIYIALYKVLWNAVQLYRAPFFGFYTDLSAPDPYFIGPILLGVAMFFQQKLTPSANMDPAQQKMMLMMPVMFTAFMLFLPSGLVLYILVNTVMGVAQQWMGMNNIRLRDVLRGRLRPAD